MTFSSGITELKVAVIERYFQVTRCFILLNNVKNFYNFTLVSLNSETP